MARVSKATQECRRITEAKRMAIASGESINLSAGATGRSTFIKIHAEPASKSNSRKLVTLFRGKGARRRSMPTLIKSAKARTFLEIARMEAAGQFKRLNPKPFDGRLEVAVSICYTSLLPDLDESVVLDALQGIVYLNDRQIVKRYCERWHGRRPWVAVTVRELTDYIT